MNSLIALPKDIDVPECNGFLWITEFDYHQSRYEYTYDKTVVELPVDELSELMGFFSYLSEKFECYEHAKVKEESVYFQLHRYLINLEYIPKKAVLADGFPLAEIYTSDPGVLDLKALYHDWKNTVKHD